MDRGFGATMRGLIGVREPLLDQVPTERHRYTGLALVVVGTAAIAAFSMWNFVGEVFGTTSVLAVIPALFWGLMIGNLDSWLVSSLHGTRWRHHAVGVVLPRLLLAVVLGFLIAEPLVLRAFHTAIETQVEEGRKGSLDRYETTLRNCNPISGVPPSVGDCSEALIVVKGIASPAATVTQLKNLKAQSKSLQRRVDVNTAKEQRLSKIARDECSGVSGAGLTGRYGEGVNCRTDRGSVKEFSETVGSAGLVRQVKSINQQIRELEGNRAQQSKAYEKVLAAAIAAKVAEKRASFHSIGLLERFKALRQLVSHNVTLAIGEWLLRLVFVLIDCLPLIVKLSSGSTAYDHLVDSELASAERRHEEEVRTRERKATAQMELERHGLERRLLADKEDLDSELRLKTARRDAEIDQAIDELTERMMKQQDDPAGTNGRTGRNGNGGEPAPISG
jgi:hypothetical protein